MADYDSLPIYDNLLTEEQVQTLVDNEDYVVASDIYPPEKGNVQIMSIEDAFAKDYEQSDFVNSDIALVHEHGSYTKDGLRFVLIPFMLHRSFRGF